MIGNNTKRVREAQTTLEDDNNLVVSVTSTKMEPYIKKLDDLVSGVLSFVEFPSSLSSNERKTIHKFSEIRRLFHSSIGNGKNRRIVVSVIPFATEVKPPLIEKTAKMPTSASFSASPSPTAVASMVATTFASSPSSSVDGESPKGTPPRKSTRTGGARGEGTELVPSSPKANAKETVMCSMCYVHKADIRLEQQDMDLSCGHCGEGWCIDPFIMCDFDCKMCHWGIDLHEGNDGEFVAIAMVEHECNGCGRSLYDDIVFGITDLESESE
jgi:hypothetical protein